MLTNKTIVLGVTGGIAAYKSADLASRLVKRGCRVYVLMTRSATEFIAPLTFETLTGNKAVVDTFDRNFQWNVEHVALAKQADAFLIAPATANVIAKLAHGLADDMLTTTVLAASCPKVVAPAMNTGMYENPVTQDNLQTLRDYGFSIVEPDSGVLACKDVGKGRLPDADVLISALEDALSPKDLQGIRVLVTAGPTCEALDPVRYITNHSSGKMGYAIARAAARRGAQVTLVSGKTGLSAPAGVQRVDVFSAQEMFDQVTRRFPEQDIVIKAAAVGDYRPKQRQEHKIKKSGETMTLQLVKNPDILAYLGEHKRLGQVICGFSMETKDLLENSRKKLEKKQADLIVANNLTVAGAGFGVDTNAVTMITPEDAIPYPVMSKEQVADELLTRLLGILKKKQGE